MDTALCRVLRVLPARSCSTVGYQSFRNSIVLSHHHLVKFAHTRAVPHCGAAAAAAAGVHDWLGQFQPQEKATGRSLYTQIIQHTDLVRSLSSSSHSAAGAATPDTSASSQHPSALTTAGTIGNITSSSTQAALNVINAALLQQHLQLPASFSVPTSTSVPAYQLVGVFRSMLGYPNLPQAAKTSSLEAKWGLLQLALLHAAGDQQEFGQRLQQLLHDVVLPHALQRLQKVQANPRIPEPNKLSAEQRYHTLLATCHDTITRWAAATCSSPAFQQLQPAMLAISAPMRTSLASGSWQCPASSASSGKLMEQAALAVLQASLPSDWSLLPSLHLQGADGQAFAVQQGCKYEADMLVLDDQGVAVAIIEVKLAAANPLMSLFNDVNALLRLVDQVQGKTVTAITRSDLTGCPVAEMLLASPPAATAETAVAAAGVPVAAAAVAVETADPGESDSDSSSSRGSNGSRRTGDGKSSLLAKARSATALPPFASGPAWQTVHVRIHPDILPIYVLGKSIGEAEVLKGVASLVDSSALKLLSTSAADVAHAIMQQGQAELQQQEDTDQQAYGNESGTTHSSSSSSSGGAGSGTRVVVHLSSEHQQSIMEQVRNRMSVLERCIIYSLCSR